MKNNLKIISYFKVHGLDLYGIKHCGYDTGKNNLESYFCGKLNWSLTKLKNTVSTLIEAGILKREKVEAGFKLYSLSTLHKAQLNLIK